MQGGPGGRPGSVPDLTLETVLGVSQEGGVDTGVDVVLIL